MAFDLGKAYVQVVPSAEGIKGSISKVLNPEADSAGSVFGKNLVSKIKKIIISAGLGKALKDAISEGANLEQSYLGGLDTLYGNAADSMRTLAIEAASAGISANSYAEQAVSFGAALKQSFKGAEDAEIKAGEAANLAILDMADNAAKMGTDLSSIQNAYQGFAKQNYTMLDNLKLGYGGTKTEMERLLKDAEELTGIKYDINNLADVYSAIHSIQKELGIAGVAADEAKTTISGSFGAMKSAYQNLLGQLTLGEDIKPALETLINTGETFLIGNLAPAIGRIVSQLPTLIETSLDILIPEGTNMIRKLAEGVTQGIPELISRALPALLEFTANLRANFSELVNAGMELLLNVAKGIVQALPDLIAYVPLIVSNIAGLINDNMPKILETGWEIIKTLGKGLIDMIPVIIDNMGNIVQAILDVVQAINWIDLGSKVVRWIGDGIKALFSLPVEAIRNIAQSTFKTFKDGFSWSSLGSNIISGIVNGLRNGVNSVVSAARSVAESAWQAAKNFLGINSPSKMFSFLGEMSDKGLAEGLSDNVGIVSDAMDEITAAMMEPMVPLDSEFGIGGYNYGKNDVNAVNYGGVTINVSVPEGTDGRQFGEELENYLANKTLRRRAVFG